MRAVSLDPLFALLIVAASSGLAVALGRRLLHLRGGLQPVAAHVLEWLGLIAAFLVMNVVAGMVVTSLARAMGLFVSSYLSADATLVILSAMQATAWQRWASRT